MHVRVVFTLVVVQCSTVQRRREIARRGGGVDVLEEDEEEEVFSWRSCENWEKVLTQAQRHVSALRSQLDSYLRIGYATAEDASAACGALYRLAEIWDDDARLLEERGLAQLLEVVELRAGELGAADAARCAWALGVLGFQGPESVLGELESACSRAVSEGECDAGVAAAACRAFACASAVFGPEVGATLRGAVARALLERRVAPRTSTELADLAASLTAARSDEEDAEEDERVVEALGAATIDDLELPALPTLAVALGKLTPTNATWLGGTLDRLAARAAALRELVAADERLTASVAWGLARGGRTDEAGRLLDVFLHRVFRDDKLVLDDATDATRLAWALATALPSSDRARLVCRAAVADAAGRLDDFDYAQRARILWAAAVMEAGPADGGARWLASLDDDADEADRFAAGVGSLRASLEEKGGTFAAVCRASWAATTLGAPSAVLCSLADDLAADEAGFFVDPVDAVGALWASARLAGPAAFGLPAPPPPAARLAARVLDALDDRLDDRLVARAVVSAAAVGARAPARLACPQRLVRLAHHDVDEAAAFARAVSVSSRDVVEPLTLPPADAAALAEAAPALVAALDETAAEAVPELSPDALAKLSRAYAASGRRAPALAAALDAALYADRLRPQKRDLVELAAAKTTLARLRHLDDEPRPRFNRIHNFLRSMFKLSGRPPPPDPIKHARKTRDETPTLPERQVETTSA